MSQFFIADAIVILKCARVEEGSWEWWLLGCWMFQSVSPDVVAAITIGGIVGASAWALRKQGQR